MTSHISCRCLTLSDYKFQDGGQNGGCARKVTAIGLTKESLDGASDSLDGDREIKRRLIGRRNMMTRLSRTASARLWLVSQAFLFHFKCYSILHFAVCQLPYWAFLLSISTHILFPIRVTIIKLIIMASFIIIGLLGITNLLVCKFLLKLGYRTK